MPDYSLQRPTPIQGVPTQAQQHQLQHHQTPLSGLSQASRQAKLETENALLREALAMSAQNCEALITQSNQSLAEVNRIVGTWIEWLKHQQQNNQQLLNQHHQNIQQQLNQLESMNTKFTKNLSDAITLTSDKLLAQVKSDVDIVIKANIKALNTATSQMEHTIANVTNYEGKLKTNLDKRIKAYDSSIKKLYQLNDGRELFFWVGMLGSIITPIVLLLNLIL